MLVTLGLATWVVGLLVALFLFVCILLILTVLIQRPQGGGLSGAFGSNSGSGQTAFGAKTGDALTIATIGMFVVYVLAAVGLNYAVRPSAPVAATPAASAPGAPATGATPVEGGVAPAAGTTPADGAAAPVEQPTAPATPGEQPTFTIPAPPPATEPAPAATEPAPATPAPTEPTPGAAPAGEPQPAEPAPATPPGGN